MTLEWNEKFVTYGFDTSDAVKRYVLILTMASTTMHYNAVAAEETGYQEIEEVVVKSKYLSVDKVNSVKTPTPIIDVPQSLSIITAEEITRQGVKNIGDIIDYTTGVNTSQGEGHRDAVVFRGVRSTADFFIDGARDDVQYYRPLYNIEQVEILRGPNALLFGRGGTGGILNRVTKKARIGERFTGYKTSFNTFAERGIELDVNFSTGEKSALRINVMYEGLENHRDFHDGDRFGFNPTVKFELSPVTTLDVSYEYIDHERFVDRGIPTGTNGKPVAAFKNIVFGDPELNKTELEAHVFRAAIEHAFLDNLKGHFSVFYGDYDKLYQNFYALGYSQASTPNVVTLDGYVDMTDRQNLILSGNLIGELVTGRLSHTLLFGGEYIDTASDQNRFNALWNTTNDDNEVFTVMRPLTLGGGVGINSAGTTTRSNFTTDLNDNTRVGIDIHSLYIQDQIEVTSWLDIVLGVRYDSFDIKVFNVVANATRTRTDAEISPRAGVILKPLENISIYGSYSESFQPRSGEQFADINGNNNRLGPNIFTNLEGGIKWDFGPALSLTAAVFENEQSSPQVADTDPSTLDVIDSEITGVEMQLSGQVMDRWSISAGYSYLDGKQVSRSGPTDLRPRELPENMFSMWNQFQVTNKIGVGVGVIYQDESFINNSNTAILPSYTRFDVAVYYDISEKIRLQLNIENLTDDLYFPNAHSTHQATVGKPLNALFTIRGEF